MTGNKLTYQNGDSMEQMTAVQFRRYGGPEVLDVVTVPRPAPRADHVLVRVEASAVNQHDAIVRSGALKMVTGRKFPLGLGLDFAGTVVASGADVKEMSTGTRVWGMVSPRSRHITGAAAQFVVVPAVRVAAMPDRLSMTDAASLVTSGTTALRALCDVGRVESGARVLVRGGAGGVGMIAVQVANALGAHVTALVSHRDLEFVTQLGAHEALDYRAVQPRQLEPFSVILDTVGTDLLAHRRRLSRGGQMITVAFGSGKAIASIAASAVFGPKRIRTFSSYPDQRLLTDLAQYVESGAIWPVVDTIYQLRQITDAHRALDESGRRGKLVLTTAS
jgi:NADPH:quinone reductase-like Zn-dependent oxidoreductase